MSVVFCNWELLLWPSEQWACNVSTIASSPPAQFILASLLRVLGNKSTAERPTTPAWVQLACNSILTQLVSEMLYGGGQSCEVKQTKKLAVTAVCECKFHYRALLIANCETHCPNVADAWFVCCSCLPRCFCTEHLRTGTWLK